MSRSSNKPADPMTGRQFQEELLFSVPIKKPTVSERSVGRVDDI
jgi:hypothetical protein